VAYPVYPLHTAGRRRYWFYVPGIVFMLQFGKNVPESARQRSAHGEKKIINVDLESGTSISRFVKDQVEALETTDKMKAMPREISAIRSTASAQGITIDAAGSSLCRS
jgi:hypothetical protein